MADCSHLCEYSGSLACFSASEFTRVKKKYPSYINVQAMEIPLLDSKNGIRNCRASFLTNDSSPWVEFPCPITILMKDTVTVKPV